MSDNLLTCPICLDVYSEDPSTDYWVGTSCKTNGRNIHAHVFHNNCLNRSFSRRNELDNVDGYCRLCRQEVPLLENTRLNNIEVKGLPKGIENDNVFKVVTLGDGATGKTSIVKRFVRNEFEDEYNPTTPVDNEFDTLSKTILLRGKRIGLKLWDTAGQERYRSLVSSYVRKAFGMLFVYDITKEQSFLHIRDWVNFANMNGPQHSVRILVGNKVDLDLGNNRKITYAMGQALAAEQKFDIFTECSAKSCYNISSLFQKLTIKMLGDPDVVVEATREENYQVLKNLPLNGKLKAVCC